MTAFGEQVAGVAALADPTRRRLYEFVAAQSDPVSRDDAAVAAGVKRPLAAFHLDKLVDEGLLDVEFRRLSGRTGPGAGRPSKLYRRSLREFEVTLPPREYDVVGAVLAAGIQRSVETGEEVVGCIRQVAYEVGRGLPDAADREAVQMVVSTLGEHGYEPRVEGGSVVLGNCPFHALSKEFTQLVCGMNLALCQGLSEAANLPDAGLEPQLDPADGRCCVMFVASRA